MFCKQVRKAARYTPVLALMAGPASADHATAVFGEGTAGPIRTIGGTTLPEGTFALSFRLEYIDLTRFSDEELLEISEIDDEVHSTDNLLAPSLGLAYGVTNRLTLGLRQPHVSRRTVRELPHHHDDEEPEEHHDEPGAEGGDDEGEHHEEELEVVNAGSPSGIGDLVATMQLRLAGPPDGTSGLALIAGLEMPTGSTDEVTSEGDRFETEHQPGSGSWGPLLGLAGSRAWGRASLHGSLILQLNTEGARATTFGNSTSYNVAFVRRFGGAEEHAHAPDAGEHSHDEGTTLDGIIELNGEHCGRDETAGVVNENSGGDLSYLSPGLRVRFAGKCAAFEVGIPILDDPNGRQHGTDYRVIVGLGTAF